MQGRGITLRDFALAEGRSNLGQALTTRLLTPRGEIAALGHPTYGSRLHEVIGQPNTPTTRNLAKLFVIEALNEERRVEAQTVWHAVQGMSERQRAVVVVRYYADQIEAEIADTLGIAPGTVKAHAHAALPALGATLRATGPVAQSRVEEGT